MKKHDSIKAVTEFLFRILEEKAKTNPEQFEIRVKRRFNPEPEDELEYVLLFTKEFEFRPYGQEIEVTPLTRILLPCSEKLSPKEAVSALRKAKKFKIEAHLKLIRPIDDSKWLAELFGKLFILESNNHPKSYNGNWKLRGYEIRNDEEPSSTDKVVIYEPEDKKEALEFML